jgi:hypothetical protein
VPTELKNLCKFEPFITSAGNIFPEIQENGIDECSIAF